MLHLLAQVIASPGDPTANWAWILLQGGSFGLLCFIVMVLAPKIIKEAREERQNRDRQFELIVDKLQLSFESRARDLITALEKQTGTIVTELVRSQNMEKHRWGSEPGAQSGANRDKS
jgi:hypothetical protein